MSDRINCRNCIHFNDLEHRCCLNDGYAIKKECYFTLSKRKPKGKDIVIENLKTKIAELEEQLKNAIRFKTPQVERFAVVQYIHQNKKPYKIVNCFDAYKDENMKTRYCFYGVPSTNFKVIQICDTKEEAEQKIKEIKSE